MQSTVNQFECRSDLGDGSGMDLLLRELAVNLFPEIPNVVADEWMGVKAVPEEICVDVLVIPDLEIEMER